MDRNPQPENFQRKRWPVVVAVIGVPLLVITAVVATGLNWAAGVRGRVDKQLAAIRAKGEPATLEELGQWYLPIPDEENAAILVQEALAALQLPKDLHAPIPLLNTSLRGNPEWPERGKPLPEEVRLAIDTAVNDNRQCLSHVDDARKRRYSRYPQLVDKTGTHLNEDDDERMTRLGQLLADESLVLADANDLDSACAVLESGLFLSETLRDVPADWAQYTRADLLALVARSAQSVLSAGQASEAALLPIAARLKNCPDPNLTYMALIGQRCEFVVDAQMGRMAIVDSPFLKQTDLASGLEKYALLMHDAQNLAAGRQSPIDYNAPREYEGWNLIADIISPATVMLMPDFADIQALYDRREALLANLDAAIAIERFRLTNGKLPDDLTELTPTFLNTVPTDPFDNQPIRYVKKDAGYVVYSIGFDRQDGGGSELPKSLQFYKAREEDIVFIVTR